MSADRADSAMAVNAKPATATGAGGAVAATTIPAAVSSAPARR
jgi:hypothetical protein